MLKSRLDKSSFGIAIEKQHKIEKVNRMKNEWTVCGMANRATELKSLLFLFIPRIVHVRFGRHLARFSFVAATHSASVLS